MPRDHQPGDPAPGYGDYEELNVFGTATGTVARLYKGDRLPSTSRGFTWRPVAREPNDSIVDVIVRLWMTSRLTR